MLYLHITVIANIWMALPSDDICIIAYALLYCASAMNLLRELHLFAYESHL